MPMAGEKQIVSQSLRKQIAALQQPRHRREQGLFVLEGTRSVLDTAACFDTVYVIATQRWLDEYGHRLPKSLPTPMVARREDMERMSSMSTPQGVLAVCRIPQHTEVPRLTPDMLVLALDRVQDPGNLGTIIRLADWWGIDTILASADTVDCFNPKVIQSTMGAIARVRVVYVDSLADTLRRLGSEGMDVYGMFLGGEPLYEAPLSLGGVIVMGNEGNGITDEVAATVTRRLTIPPYPAGATTVESLNVAVATAVTVAEFRRRASLA